MVNVALYVRLEAKPGKETAVESFLKRALPLVQDEPGTTAWFAIRMGPSTFGIFDAFSDDRARSAHLMGKVAAALKEKADDLFVESPIIQNVDILSAKVPGIGFGMLNQKMSAAKVGTAIGIVGVIAAGWYAVKHYLIPSTPYEALQKSPVTTPL